MGTILTMNNFFRLLVIFVVGLSSMVRASTLRLYVAVEGEDRIAVYRQERVEGRLIFDSEIKVDGGPRALTVSRAGQFLFASMSRGGKVASFRIDGKDGRLRFLSETAVESHAAFLHLDETERFLISAYYSEGHVVVHAVENGMLGATALQTISTAKRPHSVEMDQSNRYLFVPHTAANAIFQFKFNSQTGMVTPNEVPVLKREGVAGPRHFRLAANGKFGYGSDEQGNRVTVYGLDSETGHLNVLQTLRTLPEDFDGKNTTSDVGLHPGGRFVYVANRGHDSLAAFLIDSETGLLSFIDRFTCEAATRSFEFSPDGQYLYAAGKDSGKIAAYRVHEDTGALTRFQTVDIGKDPWAIVYVESP